VKPGTKTTLTTVEKNRYCQPPKHSLADGVYNALARRARQTVQLLRR